MLKRIINFSITIVCLLFLSACGKMPDSSEGIDEGKSGQIYGQQDEFKNTGGEAAETEESREFVRIQGHSVLEKHEFTSVTLKDMERVENDLQVIGYSRKRPGGHLRFDQGNGIIYVTGEPDGQPEPQERSIIGVILIDDQFSITGGIKAGMEISALEQAGSVWKKRDDSNIPEFVNAVREGGLVDFDEVWYTSAEVEDVDPYWTACIEVYIRNGEVKAVALRRETDIFYQFSVRDIFIIGDDLLEGECFWRIRVEEIEKEALKICKSEDRFNGRFYFYVGDGMTYVTVEQENNLIGVVLNSDNYKLDCGLKVGMSLEEVKDTEIPFKQYGRGAGVLGNILRTQEGPIAELEYDAIYSYLGEISQKEEEEFEVTSSTCRGINLFIKNDKIIAICLDFPTAD